MHTYTYQLAESIIRRNVSLDYFTFAHFIFFDVIDILNESLEFKIFFNILKIDRILSHIFFGAQFL